MKIHTYFEMSPAYDEWSGKALGFFTPDGFCLLGLHLQKLRSGEIQFGLIIFNRHFGFVID